MMTALLHLSSLLFMTDAAASDPCLESVFTTPQAPSENDLPLCGNGVLDTDEVCDDGNRVSGDGCNAYCSAFDAMTTACTLAGQISSCPFNRPQIQTPSQSIFCDLRAVDAGPLGNYIIVADYSTLLRYDLFTDNVHNSITVMPASATFHITPICSLAITIHDESILIHECSQIVRMVSSNGFTATSLADLQDILKPALVPFHAYYDKIQGSVIIAGEPVITTPSSCVQLWSVDRQQQQPTIMMMASIPCVVYQVLDTSLGITYPSYSIVGMRPTRINKDSCPLAMQKTAASAASSSSSFCYAIIMQRDDMVVFTAYVNVQGGMDRAYSVSTNLFDNALGVPITRTPLNSTTTYTSQGSCFKAESKLLTKSNRSPPLITLGNACRQAAALGLQCTTPLNNPFVTDIMSSPYLLPKGLSVTHTHNDLTAIFSTTSSSTTFPNISAGPVMYKNILQNTFANTTPIDFVALPQNGDIIYITSTSIGLISTKRTTLYDRLNQGYCRATNLLFCPPGNFGSIGSTCTPCTNTRHPLYGRSVAWQVMCAALPTTSPSQRRLLSSTAASVTKPYVRFSIFLSTCDSNTKLMEDTLHNAITDYTQNKGLLPPPRSTNFLSPMQQSNSYADLVATTTTTGATFIETLISDASITNKRSLFKNTSSTNGCEYISTMLSYADNQPLITSLSLSPQPSSNATLCASNTRLLQKDFLRGFATCSVNNNNDNNTSNTNNNTSQQQQQRRRRLLVSNSNNASSSPIIITENQGIGYATNTIISWTTETSGGNLPLDTSATNIRAVSTATNTDSTAAAASSSFPIYIAAAAGGGVLLLLLIILFIWYKKRLHHTTTSSSNKHKVYLPLNKEEEGYED